MKKILSLFVRMVLALSFCTNVNAVTLIEIYELALQNDPLLREAEANRLAAEGSMAMPAAKASR